MRQTVVTLLVFVVAFGAAWLLFRAVEAPPAEVGPARVGDPAARALPNVGAGGGAAPAAAGPGRGSATPGVAPAGGEAFPADARRDKGAVRGVYRAPGDVITAHAEIVVAPRSGRLAAQDELGFLLVDVDPGECLVSVLTTRAAPASATVVVKAGEVATTEIVFESGTIIEGTVTDGVSGAPLEGATVEMGPFRLTTDAFGRFKTPTPAPHRVLEHVVAWRADYDRQEARLLAVQDVKDVRLALTRGNGRIIGRFLLGPGTTKPPATAIVRLYRILEAQKFLRRETTLRDAIDFELDGVQQESFQLEIEFPGTSRPRKFVEVDLTVEPTRVVEIAFGRGGRVAGVLYSKGRRFGPSGLEVIDGGGRSYALLRVAADGEFSVEELPPGDYAFRFVGRLPAMQTDFFTLPDETTLALDVDFDAARVFERK